METAILLGQLEDLAYKLGIEVRYEKFEGQTEHRPGGACRIWGKYIIIVNQTRPLKEQLEVLGKALKDFDLEKVYIRPALREYLNNQNPHFDITAE